MSDRRPVPGLTFTDPPDHLPWWQEGLAWLGMTLGFLIGLTIPGWVSIASYRKWKRGETFRPTAAVAIGAFLFVGLVGAIPMIILMTP